MCDIEVDGLGMYETELICGRHTKKNLPGTKYTGKIVNMEDSESSDCRINNSYIIQLLGQRHLIGALNMNIPRRGETRGKVEKDGEIIEIIDEGTEEHSEAANGNERDFRDCCNVEINKENTLDDEEVSKHSCVTQLEDHVEHNVGITGLTNPSDKSIMRQSGCNNFNSITSEHSLSETDGFKCSCGQARKRQFENTSKHCRAIYSKSCVQKKYENKYRGWFPQVTGRRVALEMYMGLLILLMYCQNISCLDNNILQLNIPTEEPVIDPNTICKTYPELSQKQYRLCAKYPDVVASAIQGIQIAIHECQYQMKEHRWNCSSLEKKNKNPHSSPMLQKGYRESAFAYALASAGVTHQVSKACSMGKLKSCGCDMSMHGEVRDNFEWGGCSHNVEFGDRFAKKFTLARERARDIHGRINHHNNRAGRLVILQNVRKQCKCHGMSGSCEIKTCWKVSPEFRMVGDILKKKFEKANKVNISNKTDKKSRRRLVKKQRKTELVYYEKSPNFCDPNHKVDSPGTTGRYCNKTSDGAGNCDTLCCGRGYNTMKIRRTERCNCKFHWCCYVICQTCVYNEWVTVCK